MNKNVVITGIRGCCGKTKRRGTLRFCAQEAIYFVNGKGYCWYHNPRNPHKFGEGYWADEQKARLSKENSAV